MLQTPKNKQHNANTKRIEAKVQGYFIKQGVQRQFNIRCVKTLPQNMQWHIKGPLYNRALWKEDV